MLPSASVMVCAGAIIMHVFHTRAVTADQRARGAREGGGGTGSARLGPLLSALKTFPWLFSE